MAIAFSSFDRRHYPTLAVREGYDEWAGTYDDTVLDLMDIRLLERLKTVRWPAAEALDLACGTGRIGAWLKRRGVARLAGVDFSEEMLRRAGARGAYEQLVLGDACATGLPAASYDLITESLADEHFASLAPFYGEAARLLRPAGGLVVAGYHPHFLMLGMPAHFRRSNGEEIAVESHVHLLSDHIGAAHPAGFRLQEMIESVIDDDWIAAKPKWESYRNHPISFALVWTKA